MTALSRRIATSYLESKEPVTPDFWVTRSDIAKLCPPCAKRMASLRIMKVRASAIFGQDMLKMAAEKTADKWKGMPNGWTKESRKKFWDSIGGSVSKCISEMDGKVSDAGAFCASLKDRIEKSTDWRS